MIRDLFDERNDGLVEWLDKKCKDMPHDSNDECITPDGIVPYEKCHECRYYIGSIEYPEYFLNHTW